MVYYVSPEGTPAGDGSLEAPMDLATALGPRSRARPGDTILLRAGTYPGAFNSTLAGVGGSPIIVRQYAGERASIDGSLTIQLRDGDVTLGPGQLYVVPRGVERCPIAEGDVSVMLIEPEGVVNTGGVVGERTASFDDSLLDS